MVITSDNEGNDVSFIIDFRPAPSVAVHGNGQQFLCRINVSTKGAPSYFKFAEC